MNQNKVSVVIPVYNSAKFLKESIDSILNQSYKNIEVIVVNDGSVDNSQQILEQYFEKITVISQKNSGLASALNVGIKHSTGKWFKWFSPDDVMFPNTMDILVNEAEKYSNTIVYSDWEIIDKNSNKVRSFQESNYNDLSQFDFTIRLFDGQLVNINSALIPTELFIVGFMFEKLDDPVAIDYDFLLRCAMLNKTRFHLISKPLIQYRIHSTQLSHKNISHTLDYLEKVKNMTLSKLSPEKKQQFVVALDKYRKNKPISKKIKEYGLKIMKNLPLGLSDHLIIFYLNKIRHRR